MMEQQNTTPAGAARLRRIGIVAFLLGLLGSLAFFAFAPGLPHVIDWEPFSSPWALAP